MDNSNKGKCPVMHGAITETGNSVMDWWPNHSIWNYCPARYENHPAWKDFNYKEEFKKIDLEALK